MERVVRGNTIVYDEEQMKGLTEKALFDGLAEAGGNVYIFKYNIKTNYAHWSDNAIKYFGLGDGYQYDMAASWMEKIYPEDRAGYEKAWHEVVAGRKRRHNMQGRVQNAEGEFVWIECIGSTVADENGENSYFVGMLTRMDMDGKYDYTTKCLYIRQFYYAEITKPCVLLLLGMDGFRKILQNMGFVESNKVLLCVADVIRRYVSVDRVYRMSGDEFLIVLPEMSNEAAQEFFETLLREVKKIATFSDDWLDVSFSGGAARFVPELENKDAVLRKLENSLENSKLLGRGKFSIYSAEIEGRYQRIRKIKASLTKAIANNFEGFYLCYQPIIAANSKRFYGVESLLRFRDKELGIISPIEFIPFLESSGEINEVGAWVAEAAIRQKAQWDQIYPGVAVGFNVSLKQLTSWNLVQHVLDLVDTYQVNPREIAMELTESIGMDNPERIVKLLTPLYEKGIKIYLDDFGMEHSSFTLVQELPISGAKIDHSFVRVMVGSGNERKDRANKAIIASISGMCRDLDIRVVVEGVETKEIETLVCDMDVDLLQGYYYSKPVEAKEIEERWLKQLQ